MQGPVAAWGHKLAGDGGQLVQLGLSQLVPGHVELVLAPDLEHGAAARQATELDVDRVLGPLLGLGKGQWAQAVDKTQEPGLILRQVVQAPDPFNH